MNNSTSLPQSPLGLALFEPTTGDCVGAGTLNFGIHKIMATDSIYAAAFKDDAMAQVLPLETVKALLMENHPDRLLLSKGPCIGRYLDRDIPEWLLFAGGRRYEFAGTCGPVGSNCLKKVGQIVISPGLIYEVKEHIE